MVSKIKVFCNYYSSENFALLQNSYIWKLTFYYLKTFFLLIGGYDKSFFITT